MDNATSLVRNLEYGDHLRMNEDVILLFSIDQSNDKATLIDTLAAKYIKWNPPKENHSQLLPRVVIDDTTDNYLYDIPIIGKDRVVTNEVARIYYLYKICKYSKNFKFIFTLNYNIINSQNVEQFKTLLSTVLLFLSDNIDRFVHSISLIITSVDRKFKKDQINNEFGEFLDKVKTSIMDDKLRKFIDIFIAKYKNGNYENIGIFKTISKPGELSMLRQLIFENTRWTMKDTNDFQFKNYRELLFIKDDIDLFKNVSKKLSNKIKIISETITNELVSYYRQKIENSCNDMKLLQELTKLSNNLKHTLHKMLVMVDFSDFPRYLMQIILEAYPDTSYKKAAKIFELTLALNIFTEWHSREVLEIDSMTWINKLTDFDIIITAQNHWLEFLYDFEDILLNYEVQLHPDKYVSKNCSDPMPNSFGYLCGTVRTKFNKDFTYASGINLTSERSNQLDLLIKKLVNDKPEVDYNNHILKVQGNRIFLSNIPINETKYKDCNVLAIYALNKVYIDTDLKRSGLSLIIMAPKWEIVGNSRNITLDGKSAAHWNTKAPNGTIPGANGKQGEPGRSGQPGGNFLGFAEEIVGGDKLYVSVRGGNGGNGMEGGDGSDGFDGKFEEHYNQFDFQTDSLCDENIAKTVNDQTFWKGECEFCSDKNTCFIGGQRPTNGGNGGNGGPGGPGGPSGIVEVYGIGKLNSRIKFIESNGLDGNSGQGGKGGKGGEPKEMFCLKCKPSQWSYTGFKSDLILLKRFMPSFGSPGKPGKTFNKPNKVDFNIHANIPSHIEQYKQFVRNGLQKNCIHKEKLLNFLEKFNDSNVYKYYTTKDYIGAVRNLEEQFQFLKRDKELTKRLYSWVMQSIGNYSQKLSQDFENYRLHNTRNLCQGSDITLCDEVKATSHLYSMVLTKMFCINNDQYPSLVIDLKSHLDIVNHEIDELHKSLKQNIINDSTANYKATIDSQINEAKTLIQEGLMPDIDRIYQSITVQIDRLIKEIFELEKYSKQRKNELAKKKEQLKEQMKLHIIFGCLKAVSTALAFLGPYGEAASLVLGVGTMVAENFLTESDDGNLNTLMKGLPDQVSKTIESMDQFYGEKMKRKDEMLNEELNKIIEAAEQSFKNSIFVEVLKERKKELNEASKEGNFEKFFKCEKKVQEMLKDESVNNFTDRFLPENKAKFEKAIEHFEKAQKVFEHGMNIYKQYKSDGDKIEVVVKAIRKCEAEIGKLKIYRDQINNLLTPMMGKMRNDLKQTVKILSRNSKPRLMFEQYKVQRKLKDIRLMIAEFIISGPANIQEKLKLSVDKMIEVMDTTINIYNQIESFKERKETADLIALINTENVKYFDIHDRNLTTDMEYINGKIKQNIVAQLKLDAMSQFKLNVFPLLKTYVGPEQIAGILDPNMIDITDMKNKLIEHDAKIIKDDQYIECSDFTFSPSLIVRPFYIWPNHQYKEQIRKLLSFQPVIFLADVTQTRTNENCIKFRRVELAFRSHDASNQEKLNNLLKHVQIRMHHSGGNRYRCKDKYYLINSENQTITYSYVKKRNNEPRRANNVYKKMIRGDLMLSPYTTWIFELRNLTTKVDYTDFLEYKDSLDVALVGEGCFIDDKSGVCDDLNQYIEDVNIIEEDERIFLQQVHEINSGFSLRTRRSLRTFEEEDHSITDLMSWTTDKLKWLLAKTIGSVQSSLNRINTDANNSLLVTNSQQYSENSLVPAYNYDINGSLLLTNYLLRKLTGEKFVNITENENNAFQENQVAAMKLTNHFENIINGILNETNNGNVSPFDPINLQKQILHLLNTDEKQKIRSLIETVAKEILDDDNFEKFKNHVHEIIT